MAGQVRQILGLLIASAMGAYFIFDALHPNYLDYSKFEELIIRKKISRVYLLDNKAWFFETTRPYRYSKTIEWVTDVKDKDEFVNFLKLNNINLIINPSFIRIHRNLIWGFVRVVLFYCLWQFYVK
jgi:hypothetical protein